MGGSLGFSIIGGTDHSSIPFGAKEPGIFISHVSREINPFSFSNSVARESSLEGED